MKCKQYLFSLVLAMLTVAFCVQTPVFAAQDAITTQDTITIQDVMKKLAEAKMMKQQYSSSCSSGVQRPVVAAHGAIKTIKEAKKEERRSSSSVKLQSTCTCTVIPPSAFLDANGVPSKTYVINAPGSYCLGGNVAFSPTATFTPAIQILSNDVVLDLQNFTLSQASGNATTDTYGVLIGQGIHNVSNPNAVFSNITVQNGSIRNFTGVGVFSYNNSFTGTAPAELPFTNLNFLSLYVSNCGLEEQPNYFGSGINLDSLANDIFPFTPGNAVAYKYVTVDSCKVNGCLGNGSVTIFTFDDVVIRNTQANDVFCSFQHPLHVNSCLGVFAFNLIGENLQMSQCQANGATNLSPTSILISYIGGLNIRNSRNVYVKDCQFNDLFGENSTVTNNVTTDEQAIFENCQFNNARGGLGAIQVTGLVQGSFFLIPDEGTGSKFINCQFNGASVDPNNTICVIVMGYVCDTTKNLTFENCQACNIHVTSPVPLVAGFVSGVDLSITSFPQIADVSNTTYRNCIVSDISGPDLVYGYFAGGGDNWNITGTQIIRRNVVVENCVAQRISSTSSTFDVAGIASSLIAPYGPHQQFPVMFNFFVRGCRVSDVRSNSSNPSPTSAGILAYGVTRPDIIENSISDCDRGVLLSGSNKLTPNTCFQLATTQANALLLPPVYIFLNPTSGSGAQTFTNQTRGNSVTSSENNVQPGTSFICSSTGQDLNTLGWNPGDTILYNNNGNGNIAPLVSGQTYFAVVYRPGFSNNGLIKGNIVNSCTISGYEDQVEPTLSAWIDNTAFNCEEGYAIIFDSYIPVDSGSMSSYPHPGNKYNNLDLVVPQA